MPAVMPPRRVIGAYYTEAKYETIRMLRAPAFVFPTLLLPIGLYMLLGLVIFGTITDARVKIGFFTGFATFAAIGPGMFGFGIGLSLERHQGVLRLKRALPMPPAAYLLAKMLMAFLFAGVAVATISAIAYSTGRLPGMTAWTVGEVVALYVAGSIPFCALGLLLGSIAPGTSGPAVVNVVYFPMIYLSGLFFPLPPALQTLAPIWPAYHLNRMVLTTLGTIPGQPLVHVLVLAGITVACTAAALYRITRVG